jgi:cytochrome c-type biogenesis protein
MNRGAFAYALTAGMVAAVNPCGFAMLPAYLSYFLGLEGQAADRSTAARLGRALVVSATVTLGFVVVFLGVGLVVNAGLQQAVDYTKYLSIVVGLALVVLGVALLLGYRLPFTTRRLDKGGRSRTAGSMFVFGLSYAVASIGCALPIFMIVLFGGLFLGNDVASGLLGVMAYGLGMGLVLTALTVTLALAEGGLLHVLRRAMQWVDRLAGVFLILAGAYLVYYWTFNLRFESTGSLDGGGLAAWMEDQSATASTWITDRPWTLGIVFGLLACGAVVVVVARRDRGRAAVTPRSAPDEASTGEASTRIQGDATTRIHGEVPTSAPIDVPS